MIELNGDALFVFEYAGCQGVEFFVGIDQRACPNRDEHDLGRSALCW